MPWANEFKKPLTRGRDTYLEDGNAAALASKSVVSQARTILAGGRCRRRLRRSDYDASGEFAAVPLDESADRCFLGPLTRLLDGLGVPTLSFEVSPEPFDALADLFDGRIGESGVSTAGFGFLANGFGFPAAADPSSAQPKPSAWRRSAEDPL